MFCFEVRRPKVINPTSRETANVPFSNINVTKLDIIVCAVRIVDNTRAKPQRLEYKIEIQSATTVGKIWRIQTNARMQKYRLA